MDDNYLMSSDGEGENTNQGNTKGSDNEWHPNNNVDYEAEAECLKDNYHVLPNKTPESEYEPKYVC